MIAGRRLFIWAGFTAEEEKQLRREFDRLTADGFDVRPLRPRSPRDRRRKRPGGGAQGPSLARLVPLSAQARDPRRDERSLRAKPEDRPAARRYLPGGHEGCPCPRESAT